MLQRRHDVHLSVRSCNVQKHSHTMLPTWVIQVGDGTRAQVDEILDHFNINAGNPATCMTQVCVAA